jgi:hypothetical protein
MPRLTATGIAENLEILRAETQMLRIVVTGLAMNASQEARDYAIGLIKKAAETKPRFAADPTAEEWAKIGITQMASAWIAVLSPESGPPPTDAAEA